MPYLYYNMDLELSKLFIPTIGIAATIIAYGLREFAKSVKELKSAVYEMNMLIAVVQERITNIKSDKDKSDYTIDTKINTLSQEVNRIDCEVSELRQDVSVLKALKDIHK